MNYDVAMAVMNPETTQKLDGIVVVDHYVKTPEQTVTDLKILAHQSHGRIVLGEVGAPIPDIHGGMTEDQQDTWTYTLLKDLSQQDFLIGINYWTGFGASTEIWNSDLKPHRVVKTLTSFYKPFYIPQ